MKEILLCDLNNFYASCEVASDDSLKGLPIAVAGNVEERKAAMTLEFYSSALYKSLDATWQMYSNGKHLKSLDEMRFFTAIYLNLVLKQNELALVVTKGTNNETIVQGKIETIKNMFADYLTYTLPAKTN